MKNKIPLATLFPLLFLACMAACKPAAPIETIPVSQNTTTITPATSSPEPAIDYKALTEEELASLIDNTTANIETAGKASVTAVTQAISDNTLTDEESTEILTIMHTLQSEIDTTHELVNIYTNLYEEIAEKTTASLLGIDDNLATITATANEITTLLEQDRNLTPTEIDQINAALTAIETQSTENHAQSTTWLSNVQTGIEAREKLYANTPPQLNKVAYNRIDAFTQAHDFLDAITIALSDEKFSYTELAEISQLAATAEASLYNTGDPQLITIAQQINDLTHNASRGEWAIASSRLSELKFSLPARPRP